MLISQLLAEHETQMLKGAARIVDRRLGDLAVEIEESDNPDMYGLYDAGEYLTGFGFVACQTFLTSTSNHAKRRRPESLELGPRHVCGESMAALVDAAANHWKHHAEWDYKNLHDRATVTIERLERLGVTAKERGHYPIVNTLYKMLAPNSNTFENLVPFLERWRDSLWERPAA